MNKFLEKTIFAKIKKVYEKNKKVSIGVIVMAMICVSALTVYALMPKVSAASGTMDSPYVLTSGAVTPVEPGVYYAITGNSSSTYTLSYTGSADGTPAYVILDNANFTLNSDIPAIEFTGQGFSDGTSSYAANIQIIIKGENTITSYYNGATQPLIKAENMSYDVKVYDKDSEYVANEKKFKTYTVNRQSNITFSGTKSSADVLKLVTAANSTGAAIGSAELETAAGNIDFKAGNGTYYVTIDGVKYKHGQEVFTGNLSIGNGTITVANNANIIIEGNGFGAGIGSGASINSVISFKGDKNLAGTNIQTASAEAVMRKNGVKIQGGTLSVNMGNNAVGSCIGTGAIAGNAYIKGIVEITGGSVDVNPAVEGHEFAEAYDANGKQIYKFILDIDKCLGADGVLKDGETFELEDTAGGEKVYYAKFSGSDAAANGYLDFNVDTNTSQYIYTGYAEKFFDYSGAHKLYFYLPTEKLNPYTLTVDGDLGSVEYQYSVNDSDYSNLEAGYGVKVKETKNVSIKLNNVPKYCTSVTYETSSGRSGIIQKDEDENYILSFEMPSNDYSVTFSYAIGKYNINYNYGISGIEAVNGNPTTYACGETCELENITASGFTFAGWFSDAALTNEITSVTLDEVNGTVVVYAKWVCTVSFKDYDGNVLFEKVVDYGSRFMETSYPEDPADTDMKAFQGWNVNGTVYEPGTYPEFVVTQNTEIIGDYKDIGYYVYINGTYTDQQDVTTIADVKHMSSINMFFKGSPIAFTDTMVDDRMNYQTVGFADRRDVTTGSITAKSGYQIASITVADAEGNPMELFTSLDENHAFTFTMPNQDIYITVNFVIPDYTITYYDYDAAASTFVTVEPADTQTNPTKYAFNAKTEEFALNPAPQTNKYKKFAGWYVFGDAAKTIVNSIPTGAYSSNIVLIATWEDVVTYDITIDEKVQNYIKVVDEDGAEVTVGIPGEKLNILVQPGPGIKYESMTYTYTDDDNGVYTNKKTPSEDAGNKGNYKFSMPAYEVGITGEFSVITYKITYLNLNGAEHSNPQTYTVEDVFELTAPVKEGYIFTGWNIVLPDSETGYDGVREEAITAIEHRTGNLILTANWEKDASYVEPSKFYKVTVGDNITNGTVHTYINEAYEKQYVFVNIAPERGYKLKSLSYQTETPVVYSAVRSLRALEAAFDMDFDLTLFEIADGIYYFVMPNNDVDLIAEFEPIEYNIEYVDGKNDKNPEIYTVASVITLENPEKSGYEFLGWYNEEDEKVETIADSIGDLILTAKWKEIVKEPEETTEPPKEEETKEPETEQTKTDAIRDENKGNNDNNGQMGSTAGNNSDSLLEQILSIIKDKSQVSEDTALQNNNSGNKGNTDSNTSNKVVGSQLTTGDQANISHLALLCIGSLIIIFIAIPKKRDDELN